MVKEIFYTAENEEWLALRRGFIGGSDAAAVVGMSKYTSPYKLWADKTGRLPSWEGNLATRRGHFDELFVVAEFERATGKKVDTETPKNRMFVNDKYPHSSANLDGIIIGENAFLECKTTASVGIMRQLRGAEFPEAYYCQCLHYLAVKEFEKCYLAVLTPTELHIYEMERDEEEINALMNAETAFWRDYVITDTPPTTDGENSTTDTVKTIFSSSTEGAAADLNEYKTKLQRRDELLSACNEMEKEISEIENEIKTTMADAESGIVDGYKITWKTQSRKGGIDTKMLQAAHPEINLEDYTKPATISRPFKITAIKEK